jgi:hypothetical protein
MEDALYLAIERLVFCCGLLCNLGVVWPIFRPMMAQILTIFISRHPHQTHNKPVKDKTYQNCQNSNTISIDLSLYRDPQANLRHDSSSPYQNDRANYSSHSSSRESNQDEDINQPMDQDDAFASDYINM